MTILTYPNDILREPTKAVDKVTAELVKFANDMYKAMITNKGVGLAAPQVGRSIKLIVMDNGGRPLIMFNPVIMKKSHQTRDFEEGCLSFPGQFRKVKRAYEVQVKYRDMHGKMQYLVMNGFRAVVLQHECDHLISKLLIDHEDL